jgi:hypothetical protein
VRGPRGAREAFLGASAIDKTSRRGITRCCVRSQVQVIEHLNCLCKRGRGNKLRKGEQRDVDGWMIGSRVILVTALSWSSCTYSTRTFITGPERKKKAVRRSLREQFNGSASHPHSLSMDNRALVGYRMYGVAAPVRYGAVRDHPQPLVFG